MNAVLTLITAIFAIVLITFGVNNISEPSNFKVWIGIGEVMLALAALYFPLIRLFKKL